MKRRQSIIYIASTLVDIIQRVDSEADYRTASRLCSSRTAANPTTLIYLWNELHQAKANQLDVTLLGHRIGSHTTVLQYISRLESGASHWCVHAR